MSTSRPTLHSQLAAMIRRKPITVTPDSTLREAVLLMSEHRIGSIIVVEPESGRPLGIFTLRDLLHRVAAKHYDLDQMVMSVMSGSGLLMLNWRATVYQAALMMARNGVHHVIVVDATDKLVGIVSQEDIYELQSGGGKAISGAIRGARDMEGLIAAADDIHRLAERTLAEGTAAEALTQLISTLNDHLVVRLIELTKLEFDLPKVPWTWLSFGSEGRFEQTLSTDQDNGLVFAAPSKQADEVRAALLPFAAEVNRRLDVLGFPLCKGNVMASNPELCLSLDEWHQRYAKWLRTTTPQALLDASIYFDFRPLYGDEALAGELSEWLRKNIPGATLFLRFMAENALRARPPLGIIRDFTFDNSKEFPHTIDLKASGTRLFVDVARILALANGIGESGTPQRLRAAAEKGKIGRDDVAALVDAFFFLQQMRLRQQQQGTPLGLANRVDPDTLNELDRFVLRESFKQAKKLQNRIRLDYRL
ncbi:MAG: CBS domain-containing protein [Gammaproteobacteria bacterium]|nr:CBS domain-containing protein [Rhodocyclaceae bacterium]MBU3910019.1 CBS domain-containing protein [Gammaproteobacteria bacterium]MBU3989899.1 CBS domain-containing protein [Gammaproteobacteria bacterium]MBU4003992.1 CBS domain-containing protein [Gammaproteobacteria bacterium]MBU4020239.1 CBS domain-containing protein [Gammaproteobacteria bacterium]